MHARIDSSTRSNDLYLKEMPVIAKFKKAEFIIGKKASLDDNDFYIDTYVQCCLSAVNREST